MFGGQEGDHETPAFDGLDGSISRLHPKLSSSITLDDDLIALAYGCHGREYDAPSVRMSKTIHT